MGFVQNGAMGVSLLCFTGAVFSGPGSPVNGIVSGMGGAGTLLGAGVMFGAVAGASYLMQKK